MRKDTVKDARYRLSREEGTIFKDWGGRIPVALIYPNTYYIGMSNLGIHAIYSLLNSYPQVVCERVFWEEKNRIVPQAPLSLESQRPLADFAVLAFSITFELDYFNIVAMLKASGLPLYASYHDERHPLVIAGGPCVIANPMPLAPFFDCLCIGEAEAILPAMLPILAQGLKGERQEMLKALASLPGIYVPQVDGSTAVTRQWAKNLDDFPVHSVILTPDTELGDLYLIEVERGCNWNCRFCLVSHAFRPMRFRALEKLITQAEAGLKYRKRLGLVGAAVSDHPQFEELLITLEGIGAGLSISSLRIKPLHAIALRELARGGGRTIALAPEAGSQRLRDLVQKGFSEEAILEAMSKVAEQGLKKLKLYFMMGLPSETDEDIEAIITLTLKCKAILDNPPTGCRLVLSIAPFMPKASTPFQWFPMEQVDTLNRRLALLKNKLRPKGIKVNHESLGWSEVQAVLARGDEKLAEVLANMEGVTLAGWKQTMKKYHLEIDDYAHQQWAINRELPWAVLDSDIKPRLLIGLT